MKKYDSSIAMVFDDDKDQAMRCYSLWCEIKKRNPDLGKLISAMCFADDKVYPSLQGADILAHQTHAFLRNAMDGRNPRPHFLNLFQRPDPSLGIEFISEGFDLEGLKSIAKKVKEVY